MSGDETCLETERLVLEPLRREHAAHLFPALSDTRIYLFIPREPPASLSELEARYAQLERRRRDSPDQDELWLNWAIRLKASADYLGTIQATVRPHESARLAYELSTVVRGRGYATEGCSRIITSLFDDYHVVEIVAEVDTRNNASRKLLERLSFERVGMRERADFFKGSHSDEYTYRLARR